MSISTDWLFEVVCRNSRGRTWSRYDLISAHNNNIASLIEEAQLHLAAITQVLGGTIEILDATTLKSPILLRQLITINFHNNHVRVVRNCSFVEVAPGKVGAWVLHSEVINALVSYRVNATEPLIQILPESTVYRTVKFCLFRNIRVVEAEFPRAVKLSQGILIFNLSTSNDAPYSLRNVFDNITIRYSLVGVAFERRLPDDQSESSLRVGWDHDYLFICVDATGCTELVSMNHNIDPQTDSPASMQHRPRNIVFCHTWAGMSSDAVFTVSLQGSRVHLEHVTSYRLDDLSFTTRHSLHLSEPFESGIVSTSAIEALATDGTKNLSASIEAPCGDLRSVEDEPCV